jgi:hypothetical protein
MIGQIGHPAAWMISITPSPRRLEKARTLNCLTA